MARSKYWDSSTQTWKYADSGAKGTVTTCDLLPSGSLAALGYSNRNLIDNGWFTINQRGSTSYSTEENDEYGPDRWRLADKMAIDLPGGCASLGFSGTGGNAYLTQIMELDNEAIYGKNVTLSVMDDTGTIYTATGTMPSIYPSETTYYITLTLNTYWSCLLFCRSTGYFGVQFKGLEGDTAGFFVKAVKLEIGTESTLVNDTAPNYAEELAKCQRYFVSFYGYPNAVYGFGGAYSTSGTVITIPLPVQMREIPTLTYENLCLTDQSATFDPTSITVYSGQDTKNVSINVAASGLTAFRCYWLSGKASVIPKLWLSADLS